MPPGIVQATCRTNERYIDELHPDEWLRISTASKARQAEFATGRHCLRQAFKVLGVPREGPILSGSGRQPVLPSGVAASITHKHQQCLAIATTSHRSVGVDVELKQPVSADLWPRICTAHERSWLHKMPDGSAGLVVRSIFAAKEAFYKCQYPLTRAYLGYGAIQFMDDPLENASYEVLESPAGSPSVSEIKLRVVHETDWVLSLAYC